MENTEYFVVNEKGEILRELGSRYVILNGKQIDYSKELKKLNIPFVKLNPYAYEVLEDYTKYISKLLKTLEYQTNILKFSNGRTINKRRHFDQIFGVGSTTCKKILKYLEEEDVIHKCYDKGIKFYVFNPYIAQYSDKVSKDLIKEFRTSKWRDFVSED